MIVSYRKEDSKQEVARPKKKVKLYHNKAYMEALKEQIIREHNEKIKALREQGLRQNRNRS